MTPHKPFPHRSLARLLHGHKLTTPAILVALRTLAAHSEIPAIPYYCVTMAVVDRTLYPALYVDTGNGATFGESSLVIPFRTDADGDILGLVEYSCVEKEAPHDVTMSTVPPA